MILSRYPRGFYAEDNWSMHTAARYPLGQMPPGMSQYSVPVGLEFGRFAGGSWVESPTPGRFASDNGMGNCNTCGSGLSGAFGDQPVWWPLPGWPFWPTVIVGGFLAWKLFTGSRSVVQGVTTRRRRAVSRRERLAKAKTALETVQEEPGYLF